MTMLEIAPLSNGAHRNQTTSAPVPIPEGWALVPNDLLPLEHFPFGQPTIDIIEDVPTVTGWVPGDIPPPAPVPEPEPTMEDVVKTMLGG